MSIDLGYILGHACELALFLYFANTTFIPRKSYYKSSLFAVGGYAILYIVGLFRIPWISIASFLVINAVLLAGAYLIKLRVAVFYSMVMDGLSCVGEYLIIYLIGINYSNIYVEHVEIYESLIVTVGGKLFYLIGILLMKRFINGKESKSEQLMILSIIPASTIVLLTYIMSANLEYYAFCIICFMSLIVNSIVFFVSEKLNKKNKEFYLLQKEYNKNKAELWDYQLISEKYENTRIIQHDFKNHIRTLKRLLESNNPQAREYMLNLEQSLRKTNYAKYSNNNILNILLTQKIKESHEHGVEIHIQTTSPNLNFLSEMDTVAIFSNLLDNAIEAAEKSSDKIIFLDMYTVNDTYSTIKIENSTDEAPIILDGILRTQKIQKEMHGLGVKSINNALKKYGSKLCWSYDKGNKFFRAVVVLHHQ